MQLYFTYKIENNYAFLDEEEMQHAVKTLRKKQGDRLHLMDGKGNFYEAEISEIAKREVKLRILSTKPTVLPWNFDLHLAVAPTKNADRLEWMLEKVVEMGINSYTPLLCRHSERKQLRVDRLEKIAMAAAKQSQKSILPKINELTDFEKFVRSCNADQRYIAHCQSDDLEPLRNAFKFSPGTSVLVLIGPEGDFSPDEVALAVSLGFKAVGLGKSRLRTETAGIAACHTLQLFGDIG
jgi:16S rRNA (uracil1498-N3)-methyltransferase